MTLVADHISGLTKALRQSITLEQAATWGSELAGILTGGGRLLAAGTGGSAAQAQHLTAELVGRYRDERPPYSAICLSSETSSLTAIANDYPADELFARQVQGHGREGDALVLMSTSGTSANILSAARRGLDAGMRVWGLTGPGPNPLSVLCHETLIVEAPLTCTVQEVHLVALHLICESFDEALTRIPATESVVKH